MNNIIDKIRKRSHRRQGSSASQSSASISGGGGAAGDDTSSNHNLDFSESRGMPESISFRTAPLVFNDDPPSSAVASPERSIRDDNHLKKTSSFSCDLGESSSYPGGVLRRIAQKKSRFSHSLMDVLNDPVELGYFVTFLDSQGFKHLVKFWLETETFRVMASRLVNSGSGGKERDLKSGATNGDISINGLNSTSMDKKCSPKEAVSKNLRQMTEQDAVAIFSKYISKEATQSIGATDELRNTVIDRICDVDGRLDPDCFAPAQQFVLNILEKRFFNDYLNSVAHCKYVLELLNYGPIFITDILYNDAAVVHFTEFMEQEGQRHLIEFCLAVNVFQRSCDGGLTQTDAMEFYEKYFSLQAKTSLGFDDELHKEITLSICREDGLAPSLDCFEKPYRYIMNILEQKYLPKFLHSIFYARYLSELVNAARYYDLDLPNPNRGLTRKASTTGSTVSSGDGGSGSGRTRNTLLAHESPSTVARRKQVEALADSSGSDMAIETSTYDPNTLWKRDKNKHGFGYVDPVTGRYVREYSQASQHRRSKSGGEMISEAVRKLVHKDNKEQEALAEEVAALIIRDVTNMTGGIYGDGVDSATGSQDDLA